LFYISLAHLLTANGFERPLDEVYRKIQPRAVRTFLAEEAWVTEVDD
jgi:hypothetical protein